MIFTNLEMNEVIQKETLQNKKDGTMKNTSIWLAYLWLAGEIKRFIVWEHRNVFQEGQVLNSILCCHEFQKNEKRKCSFELRNIVVIFIS